MLTSTASSCFPHEDAEERDLGPLPGPTPDHGAGAGGRAPPGRHRFPATIASRPQQHHGERQGRRAHKMAAARRAPRSAASGGVRSARRAAGPGGGRPGRGSSCPGLSGGSKADQPAPWLLDGATAWGRQGEQAVSLQPLTPEAP